MAFLGSSKFVSFAALFAILLLLISFQQGTAVQPLGRKLVQYKYPPGSYGNPTPEEPVQGYGSLTPNPNYPPRKH
ncbi:hypothetical protein VNO78_07530 [Psophocarpus tetragonolobus]|uniref:Uncharacterized protein n=1 Tax=Psophocarpus tetragonolobus TaxID=3891 RepID=A0AAN9T3D9_PSOTE